MFKCVGDFETVVFDGQDRTDVWASAVVPLYEAAMTPEAVKVHNTIDKTFYYLLSKNCDITIYYHNLKFDGTFWLSFFHACGYKQARNIHGFIDDKEMQPNTFKYLISDRGIWYNIIFKTVSGHLIRFLDSYKLIPLSVAVMGEAFQTEHRKTSIEYSGFRYPGGIITDEERGYIANDVLVVAESLLQFFAEGHKGTTIGTCCVNEWKKTQDKKDVEQLYKPLVGNPFPGDGFADYDDYIREAYRGGWCYAVRTERIKKHYDGVTLDVNSLYPSVMHSDSGSYYPVGPPRYFSGELPPTFRDRKRFYWFVRFRCQFKLKRGYLPTLQIKHSAFYHPREMLESSNVFAKGKSRSSYIRDGQRVDIKPEMVMTCTDFDLFLDHYDVTGLEIIDTVAFHAEKGMFDEYINKYVEIKQNSSGGRRTCAKLFLNNLYGKMATSCVSSFKLVTFDKNGAPHYIDVPESNKEAGYIPIGAAITSYARNFTIRAAQANYHGEGKPGFKYADTDSLHIDLPIDQIKGVTIDSKKLLCWKIESRWAVGWFVRAKTYIEVSGDDWEITCAGMTAHSKAIFKACCGVPTDEEFTESEREFISTHSGMTIENFNYGLKLPGKLIAKQIPGGTLLIDTSFEMR